MVDIGTHLGRRVTALISDMSQPLGRAVGNALEVQEAIETLQGRGPDDFRQHCLTVAVAALALAEGEPRVSLSSTADPRAEVDSAMRTGAAWEKFRQFVAAQGGDLAMIDDPGKLPQAKMCTPLTCSADGYVQAIDAAAIGMAVVDLGGGREKKGDTIDPAVGVIMHVRVGDRMESGQLLCDIHANDPARLAQAQARLQQAFTVGPQPVTPPPLIHETLA